MLFFFYLFFLFLNSILDTIYLLLFLLDTVFKMFAFFLII